MNTMDVSQSEQSFSLIHEYSLSKMSLQPLQQFLAVRSSILLDAQSRYRCLHRVSILCRGSQHIEQNECHQANWTIGENTSPGTLKDSHFLNRVRLDDVSLHLDAGLRNR